jgi:hypothetical protein
LCTAKENSITQLKKEVSSAKSDAMDFELSFKALVGSFDEQSKGIEKNRLDKELAEKNLKLFLETPVKERVVNNTKIIYRDVNTTREERGCEDFKKIESNTYELDWNK